MSHALDTSRYAHFPIKLNFPTECPTTGKKIKEGSLLEIRNFLGEFRVRRIQMRPGCICTRTDVKDEIQLEGNDLAYLSQTCKFFYFMNAFNLYFRSLESVFVGINPPTRTVFIT